MVFAAFYTRAKSGKAGYPRFKPYSRFNQVQFVVGDGAKWIPAGPRRVGAGSLQSRRLGQGPPARPVPGTVKTLQLKREHRRWYVIVTTDTDPVPLPPAGAAWVLTWE